MGFEPIKNIFASKEHYLLKLPVLNKLSGLQIFQVFRFGAPFVISIVLVRLLTQQSIGIYESLTLIGSSFTFFWVTGTINAFIPYYHSTSAEKRPVLVFNAYVLLAALSVLCFAVLMVLKPLLFGTGNGAYDITKGAGQMLGNNLYFYYLLYNLFNAPAFMMEYLLMLENRPKTIAVYGLATAMAQISALIIPLWLGYGLGVGVLVLAITAFLKFALLSFHVSRIGKAQLSKAVLKAFGAKALPAILTLVVGASMPYIDSFIALKFVDKAKFAIYQYGAKEMPLVMLMSNALSNVFSGDIAVANLNKNINDSLQKLKSSSKRLMHSLFPLTIFLVIFSKFLFTHVYSNAFLGSAGIFNIFMLLTISRLIFPQTIMMALLKNKTLLIFNSIEWVVNLILDFVFYYWFGLIGIAYATVFAYFLEKALEMAYLNQMGYKPADYIPTKEWIVYGMLTLGAVAAMGACKM